MLKLWSEIITHKTDAGGVQLNLADADAVARAFALIRDNAARYAQQHRLPGDSFRGVTVQPMVRQKGYELIIGSSMDVQFGPVILFGAGGILVEVFHDRALGLPPLNRTLARRLIERTQIAKALAGIRGQRPVPMDQLETLLVHFSYLLCEHPDIQEVDINPLLASPEGLLRARCPRAACACRHAAGEAATADDRAVSKPVHGELAPPRRPARNGPRDPARGRGVDHRASRDAVGAARSACVSSAWSRRSTATA